MNRSSVTIRDVANAAGVSVATVSRVVSGSEKISDQTREKVQNAIQSLKYIPNSSARTMASHKSNMIGLVVDTPASPYFSEMIGFIESAMSKTNYDLILCGAYYDRDREERLISNMMTRQVDGLILATGRAAYSDGTRELLTRVPTVLLGKSNSFDEHPTVSTDNFMGGKIGTRYLLELGHRKIAFLGKREVSNAQKLRAEGFVQTCAQWGVEPLLFDNPDSRNSIHNGYLLSMECLDKNRDITAIFAASDSMAIGTIQAADDLGLRVPEDLSVLGFDNTFLASAPRINLTTIDQPKQMMANLVVQTLLELIKNPEMSFENIFLTPTLVTRETCGECPIKSEDRRQLNAE